MSTILIISPEPWDGHFVSKHHYACELTKRGHKVLFHGPPDPEGGMRLEPVVEGTDHLLVLHSPLVAKGLRFLPTSLRRALEARWLKTVESLAGQSVDVVWSFENSRFYDMAFAGDRLKIYQQVDLNQDFHPEIAAATADLAIAISGPIELRLRSTARRLMRLTHGAPDKPPNIESTDKIKAAFDASEVNAVLVGNMDIAYLDVPLMARLVMAHPGVRFHCIGQYTKNTGLHGEINSASNVIFWGRQAAHLLPGFYNHADVLLVAYRAAEHLEQLANPHKIMEYLASGRCVLATRTLEYEAHPELVIIANNREEYLQRFSEIVADPSPWNSDELTAKRKNFANQNTYPRQLDRIQEALGVRGRVLANRKAT